MYFLNLGVKGSSRTFLASLILNIRRVLYQPSYTAMLTSRRTVVVLFRLNPFTPKIEKCILLTFYEEMYKRCNENLAVQSFFV